MVCRAVRSPFDAVAMTDAPFSITHYRKRSNAMSTRGGATFTGRREKRRKIGQSHRVVRLERTDHAFHPDEFSDRQLLARAT